MNTYELLLLALAAAAAAILNFSRRSTRRDRPAVGGLRLVVPLAVWGASVVAVILLQSFRPDLAARLPRFEVYRQAWVFFWAAVFVLGFAEDLAREICRRRGRLFPLPDLILFLLRTAAMAAIAFYLLRARLGFNIAPLLASTALLTAVVGFALQGVLGNLLSGMSMHLVHSYGVGDWISVGETTGQVVAMNWRETRLRGTDGRYAILPHHTVAAAIVQNWSQPDPVRRHEFSVKVRPTCPPGEVEEALRQAALAVPEVLRDPPPAAYAMEYADWSTRYLLHFWTRCFPRHTTIAGRVGHHVWYEFQRRGLEFPLPRIEGLFAAPLAATSAPDDGGARRIRDFLGSAFARQWLQDEHGVPLVDEKIAEALAPALRHVRYTHGETIFRQGEPGASCFVVLRGGVTGTIEPEGGAPAHTFTLPRGALFGEMSLLHGGPRTATARAEGETELLEITEEAFRTLLASRPEIPERLASLAAERNAENEALRAQSAPSAGGPAAPMGKERLLRRFLKLIGKA